MTSRVTVAVLNAFSLENLRDCLNSLTKTDYPDFEIIVVDCMTKGISEFISESFPNVKLVTMDKDIGPSAMHNVAIRRADPASIYVAFLDNDTIVDPSWLTELVICMEGDSSIGAAQAKILLFDRPSILNTNGNSANFLAVGWPSRYGAEERSVTDQGEREIAFPSGAAMLLRRSAIEKVGMYDEDYFIYADDLDAGIRIRIAGFRIVYCPLSRIYHKYKLIRSPRAFYYLNRNRLMTFLKMYTRRTYIRMIPAVAVYEAFVIGYAILSGFTREISRAYCYTIRDSGTVKQKRLAMTDYRVISDQELIEKLEGGVGFSEIDDIMLVKKILNPFLDGYRRFLVGH